jgi:GNAT superfamily N-acetyltransferase
VALLRGALETPWVVSERGILHWEAGPERARHAAWVAEEGDEVVGWAFAELRWAVREEGIGELWAAVARDRRGRGHGGALYEVAKHHLCDIGAQKAQTWTEAGAGKRFLRARGFRETRQERISAVDPRTADLSRLAELEAVTRAEGFRVIPLGEALDRPRELYEVYMAGEIDMPSDFTEDNISFEEWERETLANPDLDREGGFVVLAGERPVSIALLEVDRDGMRATNEMTATLPEFRRRSLARLAKLLSIRWAADAGVTSILTSNDRENPGMLALNDELGYRPLATRVIFGRNLTD